MSRKHFSARGGSLHRSRSASRLWRGSPLAAGRHLEPLSTQETKSLEFFMREAAGKRQWRIRNGIIPGGITPRERGNAVFYSARGWTVQQISHSLGVSERSVRTWLHRYQRSGVAGLSDARLPRQALSPAQVFQITQMKFPVHQLGCTGKVRVGKSKISYRKIAERIKSKWGISLSHERVRQIIKKHLRQSDFTDIIPL